LLVPLPVQLVHGRHNCHVQLPEHPVWVLRRRLSADLCNEFGLRKLLKFVRVLLVERRVCFQVQGRTARGLFFWMRCRKTAAECITAVRIQPSIPRPAAIGFS
jgi:hypothetical protein